MSWIPWFGYRCCSDRLRIRICRSGNNREGIDRTDFCVAGFVESIGKHLKLPEGNFAPEGKVAPSGEVLLTLQLPLAATLVGIGVTEAPQSQTPARFPQY
jgi:hypothetical protein